MKKITLTCPFTGLPFEALKCADGSLIARNPITNENMRIGFNEPAKRYLLDSRFLEHIEVVSTTDAMKILGVSRARISKIVNDGVIPSFTANGKYMLRLDDVLSYADNRAVGRPKEED